MEESSDGQGRWGQGEKGWQSSWNCGFLFESFLQLLIFFWNITEYFSVELWPMFQSAEDFISLHFQKWVTIHENLVCFYVFFCLLLLFTRHSYFFPPHSPPTWYSIPRKTHSQSHLFCLKKKKRDCANFFQSRHSWHGLHWSRGS